MAKGKGIHGSVCPGTLFRRYPDIAELVLEVCTLYRRYPDIAELVLEMCTLFKEVSWHC